MAYEDDFIAGLEDEEFYKSKRMIEFHSKVVGSTFCNGQKVIKTLEPGQMLDIIQEPENKYDKNAVRIEHSGRKLGYFPKETAKTFTELLNQGKKFLVSVSEITGKEKQNVGCNILIKEVGS